MIEAEEELFQTVPNLRDSRREYELFDFPAFLIITERYESYCQVVA
jgi:hypothetical protein